MHKHKCYACGNVWQHMDNCAAHDAKLHAQAHSCPKCDSKQYAKYFGPEAATSCSFCGQSTPEQIRTARYYDMLERLRVVAAELEERHVA